MSKANVDPAELRRFASDLNRFNQDLHGLIQTLHGRLRALETSWRDQEQQKFSASFEETARTLAKFLEASHAHAQSLNKKAAAVEEYLKAR